MSEPGLSYKALHIPTDGTPVISDVDRHSLLDLLICFYNFEHNKPKNSGALMDAWRRAMQILDERRQLFFDAEVAG